MPKRSRFIDPETSKLDLPDSDDWIEVKNRLNYGEEQRLASVGMSGIKGHVQDGNFTVENDDTAELSIDNEKLQIERLFIWITDWNFTGTNGKPVRITRDAIKALDPDTVTEIDELLNIHVNKMQELKKMTIGKNGTTS